MKLHFGSFTRLAAAALMGVAFSSVSAEELGDDDCGPLANSFGPYDYRTASVGTLKMVEDYHFTPKVERLVAGQSGEIDGDLDYTLRVFPNHHRALLSLAKFSIQKKTTKLVNMHYRVPCWFERGMRYAPTDGEVHAVYGYYLTRLGKNEEALEALQRAIELGSDSGNTYYNLGLVQVSLKKYDEALANAKIARERGFTLPGLKRKLEALGRWRD
jgi:tetratricopeptide (TPR) repeat protein